MKYQELRFEPLKNMRLYSLNVKALGTVVFFEFVIFIIGAFNAPYEFLRNWLLVGVLIGYVVYEFKRYTAQTTINNQSQSDFATQNGFSYTSKLKTIPTDGTLFDHGHTKKLLHVISGSYNDMPFRAYSYHYETGSGKSRTSHDAMIFEYTLPRVLPQFVIDSQLENVIPINFEASQKIELEGDFHKYFDLYAPDAYGVTALTIMAPDAMEAVMHNAAMCDIEVVQNKLYFYWATPAHTKEQYEKIFSTVQAVTDEIGDSLRHKDIYASNDQKRVHAMPYAAGERLKKPRIGWIVGGAIAAVFLLQFMEFIPGLREVGIIGYALFWVMIIGAIIVSTVKQQSLRREYLSRYSKDYKHL